MRDSEENNTKAEDTMINSLANIKRIYVRFILKSGAAIIRDFTETEAKQIFSQWRGDKGIVGAVHDDDMDKAFQIDLDAVEFMDVVRPEALQQGQQGSLGNVSQEARGW